VFLLQGVQIGELAVDWPSPEVAIAGVILAGADVTIRNVWLQLDGEIVVNRLRDARRLSGVLAECLGTELDLDAVSACGGGGGGGD
jgi:hypothetical protein